MSSLPKRQHAVESASEPPPWTPAGDAFTSVLMQVVRLIRDFTAAGEALARPAGQTLARWLVLETIQQAPATVAEIARRLGLARQSVQRLADVLVREGYAAYEENPAHRRAKLLRVTAPGHAALRTIQTAQRAWSDALGSDVGEADLRRAEAILDRVLVALRGRSPDEFTKPGD
jgi:DNA-binding MarR family transcriptional regulator